LSTVPNDEDSPIPATAALPPTTAALSLQQNLSSAAGIRNAVQQYAPYFKDHSEAIRTAIQSITVEDGLGMRVILKARKKVDIGPENVMTGKPTSFQ